MTNAKFQIGDMFTRKNTIDEIPLKITEAKCCVTEPVYTLVPIRLCGYALVYGESALI
jgi:hypothetical protein